MSYDKVEWHSEGDGFPKDAKPEQGGTHIGMFLTWLIDNNLIGELYEESSMDSINKVKSREMTGRDFLIEECDSKFYDEVVNDEGNEFIRNYYDVEDSTYFGDYADVFDDYEGIYDVENSWENYDKLKQIIDMRYQEWKNRK